MFGIIIRLIFGIVWVWCKYCKLIFGCNCSVLKLVWLLIWGSNSIVMCNCGLFIWLFIVMVFLVFSVKLCK